MGENVEEYGFDIEYGGDDRKEDKGDETGDRLYDLCDE
jgi:hypothetical protein